MKIIMIDWQKPFLEHIDSSQICYCEEDGLIINGDAKDILPLFPKDSVELVLTDIPYNISQKHGGLREIDYGEWDKGFEPKPFISELLRIGKSWAVWCREDQLSEIIISMRAAGIARALYWVKPNPTVLNGQHHWLPGGECCAAGKMRGGPFHLNCHKGWWLLPPDKVRYHPNQKPLVIMKQQVQAYTKPNDIVLDSFFGVGTSAIAAVQLGRRFVGIEISKEYALLSADRVLAAKAGMELKEFREGQTTLF